MDFDITLNPAEKQRSGCVVVGVYAERKLTPAGLRIDRQCGGMLGGVVKRGDHRGKTGQTLVLHHIPNVPAERVLLVGCGKEKEFNERAYRETVAAAITAVLETGAADATYYLTELPVPERDVHWKTRQAIDAAESGSYRFDQLKSQKTNEAPTLRKIILAASERTDPPRMRTAIAQGTAIAAGIKLARDLGNLPGNVCTPTYLAEQAVALGKKYRFKSTVLEEKDMRRLGMGALLSVARGSRQPPKLIALEYRGAKNNSAPVALVGKGLTFDAGGISIKPSAAMDEMKFDMCGGASVLGAMQAAAILKLPINIVGVIASSENMPDGDANKPGDIVTSMSGQTIEVLNTDAEGRLILCDALTYVGKYKPAVVVDIATLTGACVVALGKHASGLLGNNEALMQDLLNAGSYTRDRAWQLPLWEEYDRSIDSNFADMANISGGREAGTIVGAIFLARYTKEYQWAHLDIAGTAWNSGKNKGATGRPVALLAQFLINRARKAAAAE